MRLISMSTHSRLRHKKIHLENYKNAFQSLWTRISAIGPISSTPTTIISPNHLIILISSQKGLCGTFNNTLFRYFEHEMSSQTDHYQFIAVGKYAIDYLKQHDKPLLASYNNLHSNTFVSIAQALTALIVDSPQLYTTVTVYSNYQKSFFLQKPRTSVIYPLPEPPSSSSQPPEYLLEQSPDELSATIKNLMLTVSLEELLFDSLLAEQSARFISMDLSTRNADKLLISMKLEYNKTRQAAITAELTELATSIT